MLNLAQTVTVNILPKLARNTK